MFHHLKRATLFVYSCRDLPGIEIALIAAFIALGVSGVLMLYDDI